MFKSARWRNDRSKVKVVFKLQFHAAQLPRVAGDALIVSVSPADTGKPTVKSDKAFVREGRCLWENPVFETIKFTRELKSGKIHERIYNFVVGTGQSKAGIVGEASIDFANYAESAQISLISLPLTKSQTEAILNVSIQRIPDSIDHRDAENFDGSKSSAKDNSLRAQFRNGDEHGTIKDPDEDLEFKMSDTKMLESNGNHQPAGLNGNCRSESDVTVSSSEASSANETLWETPIKSYSIHQRPCESPLLKEPKSDVLEDIYEENEQSQWEWVGNSAPEGSTDDSLSTPRETFVRQHSDLTSDVMDNLKAEVAALSRQAEMSELELQTLRKQIVKESKKGQDLLKEVVCLKEENQELKEECEMLRAPERQSDVAKMHMHLHVEEGDSQALLQELRQELNHAKEVNFNLQIQLQKTQESNSQLILAVQDLDEMLEQKNQEISNLCNRSLAVIDVDENSFELGSTCETDDEQKALEEIVKDHSGVKEAYILEQQMMSLHGEIEVYRKDKDELELQMEQLALDYEIVKQENHELSFRLEQSQVQEQLKILYECSSSYTTAHELECQIESLENELKIRSKESVNLMFRISEVEDHAKSLEEEIEKQAQGFEADLESLARAKVEQEQRAIRAEETLRKTRWQTANNAEKIQEEFRRLSSQMASTFGANEKLAAKSLAEANELRIKNSHLEELLHNSFDAHNSEKDYYESRVQQLLGKTVLFTNQIEQMQLELKYSALQLEEQTMWASQTQKLLLHEIETLKDAIEKMRKSSKEMELLMERSNNERDELEGSIVVLKNKAGEWEKESNKNRCLLEQKEVMVKHLRSELDCLQTDYEELKSTLTGGKLDREILAKNPLQLKSDVDKRDDGINSMEKMTMDSNGIEDKSTPPTRVNNEIENLSMKIKLLEDQIMLKETNLETLNMPFLEWEKDLHNKINELEETMDMLGQKSSCFLQNEEKKVSADRTPSWTTIGESGIIDEKLCNMSKASSHVSKYEMSSMKSCDANSSDASKNATGDDHEEMNELVLLKERNKLMEEELKEMQGRYSEISLKFAEVEGERQQLVMKLRNLKNAKRSS